jgi:hypothetical protein
VARRSAQCSRTHRRQEWILRLMTATPCRGCQAGIRGQTETPTMASRRDTTSTFGWSADVSRPAARARFRRVASPSQIMRGEMIFDQPARTPLPRYRCQWLSAKETQVPFRLATDGASQQRCERTWPLRASSQVQRYHWQCFPAHPKIIPCSGLQGKSPGCRAFGIDGCRHFSCHHCQNVCFPCIYPTNRDLRNGDLFS